MNGSPIRDFWHSPDRMNRVTAMLLVSSIVAAIGLIGYWFVNRPVFVVKKVIVDVSKAPLKHVSSAQVHAAVAEALNGTVLSTDLRAVRQSLQSIPWVRTATIRRIWPNRLLVRIEEQQAVATWGSGRLVNRFGEVFLAQAVDHDAPCKLLPLSGPGGSERLVLERARQLSDWLAPANRSLRSLTLSEQYAWTAELTGGLTLELGRDTLATPMQERVHMFVKTQNWLAQKLSGSDQVATSSAITPITRADLRYATGYAFLPASQQVSDSIVVGPETMSLCIGALT